MGVGYLLCKGLEFGMKNFNRLAHPHEFMLKLVIRA